jgi:rRNA maturation endonuclease Nob1
MGVTTTNIHNYSTNTSNLTSGISSTAFNTSTNTAGVITNTFAGPNIRSKKSLETGRVEKGDKSKQNFTNSYENFNYHTSHEISFKLQPLSTKNKTTEDIRQYCTECGTKTKTNFKFCPSCGNKL